MRPGSMQQSKVLDLLAYRSSKRVIEVPKSDQRQEAEEAIEEIARHLLQAIRVIKRLNQ